MSRPGKFVGSVVPPEPDGAPFLYIKGPADDFIRNLVAGAEIEVEIVDNQPYSFEELEERKLRVHRALEALGFLDLATGFSIAGGGMIDAAVSMEPGLPSDPAEILRALPEDLRDSVTLTVSEEPIGILLPGDLPLSECNGR